MDSKSNAFFNKYPPIRGNQFSSHMGDLSPQSLAQVIAIRYIPKGFTIDPYTSEFPKAQDGREKEMYIVSLDGYEERFEPVPSVDETAAWITKNLTVIQAGYLIGGWWNKKNGLYYFDVSTVIYGRHAAAIFAQLNDQEAIYHPFTEDEIPVNSSLLN